jgi:hypothetical protein
LSPSEFWLAQALLIWGALSRRAIGKGKKTNAHVHGSTGEAPMVRFAQYEASTRNRWLFRV